MGKKSTGLDTESKNLCIGTSFNLQLDQNIVVFLIFFSSLCLSGCNTGHHREAKPEPVPTATFNEDGSIDQ